VESLGSEYIFHIGQVSALYKINNTDSFCRVYKICNIEQVSALFTFRLEQVLLYFVFTYMKPAWRSRHSDWLRYGPRKVRSSNPVRITNLLFSTVSRPALGPTLHPVEMVRAAHSPFVKQLGREADH
jgi:hypothetical protein